MIKILLFLALAVQVLSAQIFTEELRLGGKGDSLRFNQPQALDVSPEGLLYVVDTGNNHIQIFDRRGRFLKSVGGFGFGEDQFDHPMDIWARTLINIYVSDFNNRRVQRYNRTMHFISSLTSQESFAPEFQFAEVSGCAVDSQNDLFVLDGGDTKIIKFNRNSRPERSFGGIDSGKGQLEEPVQLDILQDRFLLASDKSRKAIVLFDLFGNFVRLLTAPQFRAPAGLTVDGQGQIFVADPEAGKVFVIRRDFGKITSVRFRLTQPLKRPVDLAFFSTPVGDKNVCRFYLIDANQLIIGRLSDSCE